MKVNGEVVDPKILENERARLTQSQADRPPDLTVSDEEIWKIAESNVVNRILLIQEGRKRFPDLSDKEVKRKVKELSKQFGPEAQIDAFTTLAEDEIRIEKLLRDVRRGIGPPQEEEIKERYKADPGAWAEPEKVHCSHIVRHIFGGADPNASLQQIMQAQELLKAGQPFDEVGKRFSDNFGQAGDLGTFARGAMVDSFENAVFRMKPGEISDVFKTEFGYHIALVHEVFPSKERSYSEARKDVLDTLRRERQDRAVKNFVESLSNQATIERSDKDTSTEHPPASTE